MVYNIQQLLWKRVRRRELYLHGIYFYYLFLLCDCVLCIWGIMFFKGISVVDWRKALRSMSLILDYILFSMSLKSIRIVWTVINSLNSEWTKFVTENKTLENFKNFTFKKQNLDKRKWSERKELISIYSFLWILYFKIYNFIYILRI